MNLMLLNQPAVTLLPLNVIWTQTPQLTLSHPLELSATAVIWTQTPQLTLSHALEPLATAGAMILIVVTVPSPTLMTPLLTLNHPSEHLATANTMTLMMIVTAPSPTLMIGAAQWKKSCPTLNQLNLHRFDQTSTFNQCQLDLSHLTQV